MTYKLAIKLGLQNKTKFVTAMHMDYPNPN